MEKENARLSIDVAPVMRTRLKIAAARRGVSLREYCLEAIQERLEHETQLDHQLEESSWVHLSSRAFARDWNSDEDSVYDNLSQG